MWWFRLTLSGDAKELFIGFYDIEQVAPQERVFLLET